MINVLLSHYRLHEDWARDRVGKYININDKVVVVPFSFCEEWIANEFQWQEAYSKSNGKYYKEVVDLFIPFGIKEDNIIWLNYFEDSNEEMKRIVKESNIIFFTGGLPDKAVERVLETGLLDVMDDSKIVIGASAGALMQLENYFISPDEDYDEFGYYEGIGIVKDDFQIEVHYEETEVQNQCIRKVLKEKTEVVYAIKDDGGIIIEDGKLSLMGNVITFRR